MGAPGRDIHEVIKLFKTIGYDGIEVRVAPDGQINSETLTDEEAEAIHREAKNADMEFSCLTSYYQNFVDLEKRQDVIAKLKRVIEIASILDCPMVRVYGGVEPNSQPGVWFNDVWTRTVTGIRETAEYAAKFGVRICIETHIGSLTMSIRDVVRLVEDVNMHNVGILFDYAWVELAGVEFGAEAVRRAARYIFHVHIKDWKLENRLPVKKVTFDFNVGPYGQFATKRYLHDFGIAVKAGVAYERFHFSLQTYQNLIYDSNPMFFGLGLGYRFSLL